MDENTVSYSPRYLAPYDDESISHYLGRWMRQPTVSISNPLSLSQKIGLGTTLWRWQRFYFNPPPTDEELEKIGTLMELEVERLQLMFPPEGETINSEPIRLCAACYAQIPYHRMQWQFQSTAGCEHHRFRLLSRCRSCGEQFPIPSQWGKGKCKQCGMLFKSMVKWQKGY
ncbi:hypothetical protein Cri9333_2172 [Crinalium epipsammum PCC 9333]|uniref:TniQ family protein n=1 Tax=Crinalium epipsammum PCC 9333 TaxID=1173022 RepID=K9VZV0_9CYAN|nr:hypothetical protein [Crinalium epipsammum]AFZ13044.1 hypothetical protein Cri9333_2172 [Crinalium epipsammum PCC 9333]